MSASVGGKDVEVNLTPILDMVFQLITFFMIVVSFKNAAIDDSVKLPYIGSARPVDETPTGADLLVLNVCYDKSRDGYFLRVYKKFIDNVEGFIEHESQASMLHNRMTGEDFDRGEFLPTRVVIRADRKTPFSALYKVIEACQKNHYRNFALKTDSKKE